MSIIGNFEVKITRETVVKPAAPLPDPHIIPFSNLDLLSGRFPVTCIYFYKNPRLPKSIVQTLQDSLAQCLTHFYPFAGEITDNAMSGEPEIVCNNAGVLFVEAEANIPLHEFDFYDLNRSLSGKLVAVEQQRFPVQVQITTYTCRSVAITFTFDHALGDGTTFGKFLTTLSELAMGKTVSCQPDHSRHLPARVPPRYDPSLDDTFVSCTVEDIRAMPTITVLLKRLYHVDGSSIRRLQRLAGDGRTKIEALSAYVWKVMADAIPPETDSCCKIGWLVDGRAWLCRGSDYIGNVLSLAFGSARLGELRKGCIADIAERIHEAMAVVKTEEHFRSVIDWVECHRPGMMISRSVIGEGGPAVVISSGRRFPVGELEFGLGSPVVGTVCSTIERLGVGYINQRQSAAGDGSWTLSAILWPEMVQALESDPNQIFQPMNRNHIGL